MICSKCNLFAAKSGAGLAKHEAFCAGNPKWLCSICDLEFLTKNDKSSHNRELGHKKSDFIDRSSLLVLAECRFCRKSWETTKSGQTNHIRFCSQNPNKSAHPRANVPRTADEKLQLSEAMKRRHEEGRAARWENPSLKESYAEAFFQKVIDNEFSDRLVLREMRFGRYSFDFAWPHKMKVIEIDGQQHERYSHQRESDSKKDKLAEEAGWSVLRIKWRDLYMDTKATIAAAKAFID